MSSIPALRLHSGQLIPRVGLGLWQITDEEQFKTAFTAALKVGYRHFDSAQAYNNEHLLGACLKNVSIPRKDIFLTTKIEVTHFGYKKVKSSFAESLQKLDTDYVDLLLLHFPVPVLRKKAWQALEEIYEAGQAKSIGVSNYTVKHLQQLLATCQIKPAVNQVELHVFLQQPELREYCQAQDIVVEAYSPLAHAKALHEPLLGEIAASYNKTSAQIMLRWCLQQGLVVLPKSITPSRITENIQIFDFEISPKDMKRLKTLESNLRTCWDPTHIP